MKIVCVMALLLCGSAGAKDLTLEIPEVFPTEHDGFQRLPNVAQYKGADWQNVVAIARAVTLKEAKHIAKERSEVTYFFYTKGTMILETPEGNVRFFSQGDAVFFTGEPWWGSAPGLADGYLVKR